MLENETPGRRRIAIVVQRYGAEITGGAEAHARALAQKLARHYDVDVYTTCARDARRWTMHYATGESFDGPVRVMRFAQSPRGNFWQRRTPHYVSCAYQWRASAPTGQRVPLATSRSDRRELAWLEAHGPFSPDLVATLQAGMSNYAAVIAFSLRFWTTVSVSAVAADRLLIVPTLHDEKAMYRALFRRPLSMAKSVMFNSESERQLAIQLYGNCMQRDVIVSAGVDTSLVSTAHAERVAAAYGINSPYFIYTGRVCEAKGCHVLLRVFERFAREIAPPVRLVLVGQVDMPLPTANWLTAVGFVDESVRDALVAGARALIQPSSLESLSLSTLEAMSLGVPVIVNGASAVLSSHVRSANAGFIFQCVADLQVILAHALNMDQYARADMGARSTMYVRNHYSWESVLLKVRSEIDLISASN